jgi:phosphoribosylanthranilate isomerase
MFIKICGLTVAEDALLAVALGADALGFVFAPSTRRVQPDAVKAILTQLPHGVLTFGVFQDERPEHVVEIVHRVGLSGAQLHGSMGPEATAYVSERVRYTVRAFAAGREPLASMKSYKVWSYLVDAASPGSGEVFDWSIVEGIPERSRLILAGGLRPENVASAVRAVRPFGVDVSTHVESRPGRKDPVKLRAFIAQVRAVEQELDESTEDDRSAQGSNDVGPYNWEDPT